MESTSNSIALEAMRECRSRGIPCLFPNLRGLYWDYIEHSPKCVEVLDGLIPPTIEQLEFGPAHDGILRHLCQLMMARLPVLRSLILRDETRSWTTTAAGDSTNPESSLVKPAQDLLTLFTNTLTSVSNSISLTVPIIVECLSRMPKLCDLQIIKTYDSMDMKYEWKLICRDEGGFTSLRSFTFEGSPETFCNIYLNAYGLTSLTTLSLNTKFTLADFHITVSSIVAACPLIRSLSLGRRYIYDTDRPVIPWSSVQPLCHCKGLTSITINNLHIDVRLEELTEFLKSRTTWTRLHVLNSSFFHLQDMLIYAKYCPNLEHLGMRITDPDKSCVENLPSDIPTFSNLTSIHFGESFLHRASASRILAQFLYRVCKRPLYKLDGLREQDVKRVLRNLVILYVDEQCQPVKSHMSGEVGEWIKMTVAKMR